MSGTLVFIYGCNLDPVRLRSICPHARVVAAAVLPGYKLAFGGWFKEWSGSVANLRRDETKSCPGVVFRISKAELTKLDAIGEGVDGAYKREEFEVLVRHGVAGYTKRKNADAYILKTPLSASIPNGIYLTPMMVGYKVYDIDSRLVNVVGDLLRDLRPVPVGKEGKRVER
jgi:gamma-glutamylcyclotransferase (GGCT)/AIG2-like uncharacterized protein YtfP